MVGVGETAGQLRWSARSIKRLCEGYARTVYVRGHVAGQIVGVINRLVGHIGSPLLVEYSSAHRVVAENLSPTRGTAGSARPFFCEPSNGVREGTPPSTGLAVREEGRERAIGVIFLGEAVQSIVLITGAN